MMNTNGSPGPVPLLHASSFEGEVAVKERNGGLTKKVKKSKEPLSAEEAKKAMGEQVAYLRSFSGELTTFLSHVSQAIASGDFGPSIVESADRLLGDMKDLKESVGKVYDVALERNYARLPPRRKR